MIANNKHQSARSNDLDQKIKSEDENLDLLLDELKTECDDCDATELNELEENYLKMHFPTVKRILKLVWS